MNYKVMADFKGKEMPVGVVVGSDVLGWRFIPHYQAKPSRKSHQTPDDAVRYRLHTPYRLEAAQ